MKLLRRGPNSFSTTDRISEHRRSYSDTRQERKIFGRRKGIKSNPKSTTEYYLLISLSFSTQKTAYYL